MATQEKIAQIADVIKSGDAFANPYTSKILSTQAAISQVKAAATGALPGSYLEPHAADIIASVNTIENTLDNFTNHTNSLSGVNLSEGLTGANFSTMASVVKASQKYSGQSGVCDIVNGAFGAIANFALIAQSFDNLLRQLGELEQAPERIAGYIDTLENLVSNQINNDLTAFANAQLDLLQRAAAAAIADLGVDPCLSEIVSIVGTDTLKNQLNINEGQTGLNVTNQ